VNAALLQKLLEAGTPVALVAEVAAELARAQAAQEMIEHRRAKDRERKRSPRNSEESAEGAEFQEKGSLEVSPPAPPLPKPSKSAPLNPPIFGEFPDWWPTETYAEFRAMRKRMRNVPFEPGAERRLVAKVTKLKAEGHDPEKLLSKAIENGHRTVFPDETTKASGPSGKVQLTAQELRERAEWFVRHGQQDRADECRQKAIKLEQRTAA
jgi:hypothetical protein